MSTTIFISAGEASGEHYGALLVAALQKRLAASGQSASFFGMGGSRMAAAGLECIVRSEDMAVMGFTEIILHLPRIWREYRKLKRAIRQRPPSVAVLIDFPEIHFRLAEEFHRLGVPVIFFVSPQLWAWKKHRIKLVRKYVDKMLVIFPFEEPFYREQGVQAEFVGHPLAELPQPAISREAFASANNLDAAKTWIGLLPGSRPKEIRDHLPTILQAAQDLQGDFQFLIPLASTLNAAQREEVQRLAQSHSGELTLRLVDDARAALFHSRASIAASGTATVEAALIGNPFIVVYRVSALTYAIAKRVVKVPFVAMANLIAGKQVVPELIQSDFTAENIVQHIAPLITDGEPRKSMTEELALIRGLLKTQQKGGDAIDRVAEITLEMARVSVSARNEIVIGSNEFEIKGSWALVEGRMTEDEAVKRIRFLVDNALQYLATSKDGWEKLYRDPQDGRYWELTFPRGEMHGGGPQSLFLANLTMVQEKYGISIIDEPSI
jgi:lipid-A-disaccharide synthase